MEIVGVIAEYNPFHNGHIYHLNKVKELFPDSLIVLIMSGHFTQRGIPSILNKWDKTEIALNYGVDLVVELPFAFSSQGADIFAHGSISLLKELKVNYLVFGSEKCDIKSLNELAIITEDKQYQLKVKEQLDKGINYPTALNNALKFYTNKEINTPNDLLAFSYIKEIIKQKTNIKPIAIKRTNDFHSTNLEEIASATSIRKAIKKNININNSVPAITINKLKDDIFLIDDYFPYLKYKILSSQDLSIYQTVDEGMENRIKKVILEVTSWDQLVEKLKTKRYTYNRINRMLIHILCGFTKDMASKFKDIEYIRILGFSVNGRKYLNKIKKEMNVPLITTFSKGNSKMLEYEKTITSIYATILDEAKKNNLIKKEYQQKIEMI